MPSPRANLSLAVAAVAMLSVMPRPVLQLVGYLNEPATIVLAPIRQPVRSLIVWFRGSGGGLSSTDPQFVLLEGQREEYKRLWLQAKQEADDLRVLVRDLSRGVELNPALAVRQIAAPVIGFGSDLSGGLLSVRAGSKQGVNANDVVVVRGVHLVGRVQKAGLQTCAVLPITDPAFPKMFSNNQKFSGVVMLDEQTRGPTWKLDTIQNGKLIGKVYFDEEAAPGAQRPVLAEDMIVRLHDGSWPQNAQMLVIGRVVHVEPSPNDRPILTVEPFQDLSQVGEVLIRVSEAEDASSSPRSGAPTQKGAGPKP